ncbi:enoyl-CoA hydratase/isomerase family protein [Streptomyces sp. SID8111]|uniref:enoyl-CoA hydratase/isomerase family protein n=1 Tax=Streptomyces sp. SID8111 TaxID=2706100 RepID=UPI0013BFC494|nr:enoyl-CoA hydratase/isomerase family protein [Streptomyces sp. SID8111]NEC30354.1 enoyl-CoA hydratase/isomerase family protein [Streptomyces sp. SID8111]NEC30494.1 enoyl-CoA hydratase/isomerase family protein [Streptomyces sp. SID8111]
MTTHTTGPAVLTDRDGPVVRLVINRPHRRNSLTADDVGLLRDALETAAADPRTRAVVVEGTGGTLCSGMDLAELSADRQTKGGSDFFDLLRRITEVPVTVLASVDGQALGGGVGLAAACDLVLATERSTFALPEALWGLLPCAILPFLMRRVGFQRAYAMTLSTAGVTASDARSFGLVDELEGTHGQQRRRLLGRVTKIDRPTVAEAKAYCARLAPLPDTARDHAADVFARLLDSPVVRTRIDNFVRHQRMPWEV